MACIKITSEVRYLSIYRYLHTRLDTIVEAIAQWDVLRDTDDARAYRARELQAEIAAMHGFDDIVDFVEQSEDFLPAVEPNRTID